MGWWSAAVMGGDGPLDTQGDILEKIGLDDAWYGDGLITEKMLDSARKKYEKYLPTLIKEIEDDGDDYTNVGYQALGAVTMRLGFPISAELKERIIEAANDDEWAREDEERAEVMKSFIEDLNKYDNKTPTELSMADEGLLFALAKRING